SANLRQLTMASLLHAQDHHGYLPLAGELWGTPRELFIPAAYGDPLRQRYTYTSSSMYYVSPAVVPLPAALAVYMGYKGLPFDDEHKLDQALNEQLFWRRFQCPATASFDKQRAFGNPSDATLVGQGTMICFAIIGMNPSAWSTNSDYAL